MDEVDTLLKCRQETHKAMGKENKVEQAYIDLAMLSYDILTTHPEISKSIYFDFSPTKALDAQPFSPELYEKVKLPIAQGIMEALIPRFEFLQEKAKEMQDFCLSFILQTEEMEKSRQLLPESMPLELKNALAFARSEIHIFLPATLNKLYGIHYGFFPKNAPGTSTDLCLAGPFKGANRPNLGSQFGHYTEVINYTAQAYHKTGISAEMLQKEVERIIAAVKLEGHFEISENKSYLEYQNLVGSKLAAKFPLFQAKGVNLAKLAKEISLQPRLLNHFLKVYVLPHIGLHEKRMSSNAQTLSGSFHSLVGFTGTLADSETFPDKLGVQRAVGTDGKTISLLWKNSRTAVKALSTTDNVLASLAEMLKDHPFSVIIDAGAFFKDTPVEVLVKEILRLKPTLEAVVYFEGDKQMIMPKGQLPVPANQLEVHPSKRFTFYDQQHCTGANILQTSHAQACMTLNKNQTLRDIFQAVWRMRGLESGQKVHFFLEKGVYNLIAAWSGKDRESLNVMDLLLYASKNQARLEAENNLLAVMQKMQQSIYQSCDTFLDNVELEDLKLPLFIELNDLLLTKPDHSPLKQYGSIESMESADKALKVHGEQALYKIKNWISKYGNSSDFKKYKEAPKLKDLIEQMDRIIHKALLRGKETVAELLPVSVDSFKGLSVELTTEVEKHSEQSIERSQRLDLAQNKYSAFSKKPLHPLIHQEWKNLSKLFEADFFTPVTLAESWGKMHSEPIVKSMLIERADKIRANYLLSAADAFFLNPEANRATLRGLFEENLFFSLNLLFTAHQVSPFNAIQKPIGASLIIQDKIKTDDVCLLALDGKDAAIFRKVLAADKTRSVGVSRAKKLALFYPSLGIVQQGREPINFEELKKTKFPLLVVQLKFISGAFTEYSAEECRLLKEWIHRQAQPQEMEILFKTLLINSSEKGRNYPFSTLARIFAEEIALKNVSSAIPSGLSGSSSPSMESRPPSSASSSLPLALPSSLAPPRQLPPLSLPTVSSLSSIPLERLPGPAEPVIPKPVPVPPRAVPSVTIKPLKSAFSLNIPGNSDHGADSDDELEDEAMEKEAEVSVSRGEIGEGLAEKEETERRGMDLSQEEGQSSNPGSVNDLIRNLTTSLSSKDKAPVVRQLDEDPDL